MQRTSRILLGLTLLVLASPALADAGTEIPEPGDGTLFALALAGLIIGRYAARRRDDD